jgi:hypothetical protein
MKDHLFTNSPLVDVTILSPNCDKKRNRPIDTITLHSMEGNLTVESCGEWLARPTTQASSNYGIGSDGRVGLYVNEADRSWCSSNPSNDHRAVTIEVANNGGAPNWPISEKALQSLIKLCADICKRNNIKALLWRNDKNLIGQIDKQNMTLHRWFHATKGCPGQYLIDLHPHIVTEVNKLLGIELNNNITTFKVMVTSTVLNVRAGAGIEHSITSVIRGNEVYDIVNTIDINGTKWGQLKTGGWISLTHTTRI